MRKDPDLVLQRDGTELKVTGQVLLVREVRRAVLKRRAMILTMHNRNEQRRLKQMTLRNYMSQLGK
jgi:hypothetical protein